MENIVLRKFLIKALFFSAKRLRRRIKGWNIKNAFKEYEISIKLLEKEFEISLDELHDDKLRNELLVVMMLSLTEKYDEALEKIKEIEKEKIDHKLLPTISRIKDHIIKEHESWHRELSKRKIIVISDEERKRGEERLRRIIEMMRELGRNG